MLDDLRLDAILAGPEFLLGIGALGLLLWGAFRPKESNTTPIYIGALVV
ncbi:MAG: hypothetical protein GY915_05485, partial [bacterium]|nr:hypothetical protein [bacterium]